MTDRPPTPLNRLIQVLLPFVAFMYLGIVLKKYSLEGYSDLVTNDYLLLGACVRASLPWEASN